MKYEILNDPDILHKDGDEYKGSLKSSGWHIYNGSYQGKPLGVISWGRNYKELNCKSFNSINSNINWRRPIKKKNVG